MFMKNTFKYIMVGIVAAVAFWGCNSLDQAPTNKFEENTFWTSKDRAQMVVNMAYNQMYGVGKMWSDEYLGDNMIAKRDRNPEERQIRQGSAHPGMGLFSSEWSWAYGGIKTTNVFMDKIHLVPNLSDEDRQAMEAQIRFIRAYLYFRLTNFYGAVPFFLGDITLEEAKVMPRTPRADVIAALHKELDEIIPQLPQSVPAARNGEIRQAAAAMLKARFYLYDGDFENTAKVCADIIDGKYGHYELFKTKTPVYSSYEDLFTSANEFNVEVILSYSMMPIIREWSLNDKVPNSTPGSMGAYFFPTESLAKEYIRLDGSKFEYPTNNTSCYTDRDPRMDATIVRHNAVWRDVDVTSGAATTKTINIVSDATDGINKGNATETGYYVRKWFDPAHRADMLISTDIIMMRYADVLLMYAESMNEIGQMSEQVWNTTIRPIRERAGFTQQGALQYPNLDQAAMRDIIRRERRCELALEGLRYFDIIRWNAGLELLNFDLMSAKFTGTTAQSSIFKYKFTSRDMLWPVPQSQINNYPSLAPQNSGY